MSKLITELGYLGFEVSDIPRWERFAGEVLGLGVTPGTTPTSRRLRMDDARYRFVLNEGPADDLAFAGWRTLHLADLEAFGRHLDSQGVKWQWASDDELALRSVEHMLHFSDPVGNRHEAYCGPLLANTRFCSPTVASGFVTGDGGLGHVVFSSSDYPATLNFARKVLGLTLSDIIRMPLGGGANFEVSFFHLNPRHHSFAAAAQMAGPGPKKRIHHFMVETNSVEDVGFSRDRCLAMGQPVSMDIGQHTNDRMISYYGTTPSGFEVEFGWGGVLVDQASWQFVTYDRLSVWGHRPNREVAPKPPAQAKPAAEKGPVSAAGAWKVVIKTPMGDNHAVFELRTEGSQLMGAIKDPNETVEIYDGRVDGPSLQWSAKVSHPLPMELAFTATIEGDTISGAAKSAFGDAPFSGERG